MRHERPSNAGEARSSALWGKGSGGQSRGSALWGRGGRSSIALLALIISVIVPAAGIAAEKQHAAVPSDLMVQAEANPDATFSVIVQGDRNGSDRVAREIKGNGGQLKKVFRSISGAAAELSGKQILKLAKDSHVVSITRDDRLQAADASWRDTVRASSLWGSPAVTCAVDVLGVQLDPTCVARPAVPEPQAPAIAILDSGIDSSKLADFGRRVVARANFSSLEPNAVGDPSGHGTMVAGVAAGAAPFAPGIARNAPLVDVRVASSRGQALTSDILAGIDWIIANKGTYNIRVANISLAGTRGVSIRFDPLDRAVEQLWLSGVVVVAAVGNHGTGGPVKIPAPGNDPFVITVGALETNGNANQRDDTRAPWSAYGPTADGFMKPDVSAPGRRIVAPVPADADLAKRGPGRVVAPGYMWMSGTSFAAPIVAGMAAHLLARHPEWTPDQVKGALMVSATYLPSQDPGAGVGEVNAERARSIANPPNPNLNLYSFVSDGEFDAERWADHVRVNSNWTVSNWTASNWVEANWTVSNWVSSNWVASNWVAANWTVATDEE